MRKWSLDTTRVGRAGRLRGAFLALVGVSALHLAAAGSPRPEIGLGVAAARLVQQGEPPLHGALPRNRLSAETARAMARLEDDPYWLRAKATVDKSVVQLLTQRHSELQNGIVGDRFFRGDSERKQVAITFDDGPHPQYTPRILEILRKFGARATFFVVGEMAEQYPELVRAEADGGHDVGNHTYHHVSLPKIPPQYVATEIKACGEVIHSIIGRTPHLFRPPGGQYDERVAGVVQALGYKMVLWTSDPGDYMSPGEDVIERRILRNLASGSVILLHDGVQQTIEVLPQLLASLKRQGYDIVTIDQMLGLRPHDAGLRLERLKFRASVKGPSRQREV